MAPHKLGSGFQALFSIRSSETCWRFSLFDLFESQVNINLSWSACYLIKWIKFIHIESLWGVPKKYGKSSWLILRRPQFHIIIHNKLIYYYCIFNTIYTSNNAHANKVSFIVLTSVWRLIWFGQSDCFISGLFTFMDGFAWKCYQCQVILALDH